MATPSPPAASPTPRRISRAAILTLGVFVGLFFAVSAGAAERRVHERTLENGLQVRVLENHRAPTATFQVWYRVGSRDEPMGKSGLSHLLEHMMFKGTTTHGPKTFSQTIRRAGGRDNAFTTREYTGYFQLLAADRIELAMELEADRMKNLLLEPSAVMAERDVVMEERRTRYEDDPQSLVFEEGVAAAFKSHPYRRPVIGWMDDLKTITPADLRRHYRTWYAPNNAVVLVVGDVDPEEVFSLVEKHFGGLPRGPALPDRPPLSDAPQNGPRRVTVQKEAELPYVLRVYKVPGEPHKDSYALDVLASILSGGRSARLFDRLVYTERVALSAWAGYDGMMRDPFLFYLGGTAAPGKTADELEDALDREVARVRSQAVEDRELTRAKNQVVADFVLQQDSIYMEARVLGAYEMIGSWRMADEYRRRVAEVTAEDVRRVAQQYLVPNRSTTGILLPLKTSTAPAGSTGAG